MLALARVEVVENLLAAAAVAILQLHQRVPGATDSRQEQGNEHLREYKCLSQTR
jgi:hypothetical protein